jgi:hypothetical protein
MNSVFVAAMRGYMNLRYLLLKSQRIAATNTEFIAIKKAA